MKIHHKRSHGESIAGVVVECDHCGDNTRTEPHKARKLEHHFCNQDCEGKWRSDRFQGEKSPVWKRGPETVQCHLCGAEVERRAWEIETAARNFCSNRCRGEWRSKNWEAEDYPRWQGGKATVECSICSEEVSRRQDQLKKYDQHFCSTDCLGEWRSDTQRGRDNPVWTGGSNIRDAVRRLLSDEPWTRIAAAARDDECEHCGSDSTEYNRSLAVHHIVPVMAGGSNAEELLMTLCPGCHRKVEAFTRRFVDPVLVEYSP